MNILQASFSVSGVFHLYDQYGDLFDLIERIWSMNIFAIISYAKMDIDEIRFLYY